MRRPKRVPLEGLAPYLYPTDEPRNIVWSELFGNDRPVEIEVGFGKGMFLLNAASTQPDVNFFGIEIERKYQLYAATRIAARELRNVRVASTDAKLLLEKHVADASVDVVHVYFPDPWWKRKHHKRRLFTFDFAQTCERILKPLGKLSIATDVEDYFQMVRETMQPLHAMVEVPPPPPTEAKHDLDYLTNFERKFRKQGKPIWRVAYQKTGSGTLVFVRNPDEGIHELQ